MKSGSPCGVLRPGSAPEPKRRRRPAIAFALPALILALSLPASAAKAPYGEGDPVRVVGVVTDTDGQAVPDVEIVLEASNRGLSLRPPSLAKKEISRGSTRTAADGSFGLEWSWRSRFDRFELIITVPYYEPAGERLRVLHREDITRRVRQGSPVAVSPVLEDTRFLETLRTFLADVDSTDERRVYEATGQPDRLDRVSYPGHLETSWWYFELGRVYRFEDGVLRQVTEFDPVEPL